MTERQPFPGYKSGVFTNEKSSQSTKYYHKGEHSAFMRPNNSPRLLELLEVQYTELPKFPTVTTSWETDKNIHGQIVQYL